MNPNSVRPRRLHVSALAAVANPSYTRLDTWNLLDDACRHLFSGAGSAVECNQAIIARRTGSVS